MGKRLFFAVCAALGCVFAGAESLAFQIVQHGGGFTKVAEPSLIVEDEIINSLFDAGFIVSNIPAALSSSKKDDERLFAAGTGEAASNSFDSFLSIHLFFNNQAIQDEKKSGTRRVVGNLVEDCGRKKRTGADGRQHDG